MSIQMIQSKHAFLKLQVKGKQLTNQSLGRCRKLL